MTEWYEFRMWWGTNPNQENVFAFKKKYILLILKKYGIEDFLTLDECENNQFFVLLRINVSREMSNKILKDFEEITMEEPIVSKVTLDVWSPTKDARTRILEARKRAEEISQNPKIPMEIQGLGQIPLGGWMINGKTLNGKWQAEPENLDKQVEAFSVFMMKVVGKFTEAYIKEMPYRVEDRWLRSVFLHLLLDSISTWQKEEYEVREFPFI